MADTLGGIAAGMRAYVEAKEKGDNLRAEREYRKVSHKLDTMTQFARLGQEKERLGLMRSQQELAKRAAFSAERMRPHEEELAGLKVTEMEQKIAREKTQQAAEAKFSEYFETKTGMPAGDMSMFTQVETLIQLERAGERQKKVREAEEKEEVIPAVVSAEKAEAKAREAEAGVKIEVIDIEKEMETALLRNKAEDAKLTAEIEKSGYEAALAKARKPLADATAEHEFALLAEDVKLKVSQIEQNAAETRLAGKRAEAAEQEIEAMELKFEAFGGAGEYYKALFDAEQAKLKADAAPIKLNEALGNVQAGISAMQRLAGGGPLDRLTLLFLNTKIPGMVTDPNAAAVIKPEAVRRAVEAYIGANMALIAQWYPDADISLLKQQFKSVAGYDLTEGGGLREAERLDEMGGAGPAVEEETGPPTPSVPLGAPAGTLFDEMDYDELDDLLEGME